MWAHLLAEGVYKRQWPSGLQRANEDISEFCKYRAELQKCHIRPRFRFWKKDKPAQNHAQAHKRITLHGDGAMPSLNGTSGIVRHPSSGSNSSSGLHLGSGGRSDIQQWLVIRQSRYEPSFLLHIPGKDVATYCRQENLNLVPVNSQVSFLEFISITGNEGGIYFKNIHFLIIFSLSKDHISIMRDFLKWSN